MADNAILVRRWFEEVWNQNNDAVIDELLTPTSIIHGLVGEDGTELDGPAHFKAFHRKFVTEFPGLRIDVADVVADGDKTAVRCIVTGNHGASGKPVKVQIGQ